MFANNSTRKKKKKRKNFKPKVVAADPELLRIRAKSHILRREWHQALKCLDQTLTEPEVLPHGEEFVPSRQSLVIRGRVHLILNHKSKALEDALTALNDLDIYDPIYTKALILRADALYQMGNFEHALVFYHRGNSIKGHKNDQFRLGIQKTTEAILNCLKFVKPKMKVDVLIDDTSRQKDRQRVMSSSYVFPIQELKRRTKKSDFAKCSTRFSFCPVTAKPFREDILALKGVHDTLKKEGGKLGHSVEQLISDALSYATERNNVWMKQDATKNRSQNTTTILDLNQDNLPFLI